MKLLFGKSRWEMGDAPLEDFLRRAQKDSFDAVELYIGAIDEPAETLRRRVENHGFGLVAFIGTNGATPEEHIDCLDRQFALASATRPLHITSHTGRDIFSFEDNCRIFQRGLELSRETGIRLTHETHRSRALFCAPVTHRYLKALPELSLNADFSHWVCVHESDLSDQPDNVTIAIQNAHYIHARIGYIHGPQVPDPSAPEWGAEVELFIGWWQRILEARKREGCPQFVVTPEFGPAPYMQCEPHTGRPLADTWTVNTALRDLLVERFL